MMTRLGLLALLAAWFLTGCSTHYYEGEAPRTASEVKAYLAEVGGAQGQGLVGGNVGTAMQAQDTAVIYYGEAANKTVASLLSFQNFDWLSGSNVSDWRQVQGGRVFLLDNMAVDKTVGLVIGIDSGSGYNYFGFSGQGEVRDGVFRASLSGAGGSIEIESIDHDGSVLDDIIQLRVYYKDGAGNERYGKISTLFAYQ